MAREVTNIAASVRARLQNVAKDKHANFQRMLTRYALERLLFRLSVSRYKDSFVLKGAMLYAAWLEDPFRTTRDLDLLSLGAREGERLAVIFRDSLRAWKAPIESPYIRINSVTRLAPSATDR